MTGMPHKRKERVPVPLEVRTRLLAFGPKVQTIKQLGISIPTYESVVDPHDTLPEDTLAHLIEALNRLEPQSVQKKRTG